MCLDSPIHQEPLDVMSTDDSGVLPGPPSSTNTSVTLSDNTSPSAPYTLTTMRSHLTPSGNQQVLESSVDVPERNSQISLSSLSESNEDIKHTRFEVTSLDAISLEGDLGEKREHANSAFEIMSVVEDLDNSTAHARQPTSAEESLRHISKGESGSEEETSSLSEASRVDSSLPVDGKQTQLAAQAIQESSSGQLVTGHTDSSAAVPGMGSSQATLIATSTGAVNVGNGATVLPGPSRFKRVNKYERGRWIVKDMANTEESQKDPKNPQKTSERSISQEGSVSSVVSPAASRKILTEISDSLYSGSTSDLGPLTSSSGMLNETNSEKDSAGSYQFDRSSTAAESTLSRNTSLSSIIQDEHLETESVASTGGKDRDTPEIVYNSQQQSLPQQPTQSHVPQQPSVSTSSSTTAPVQVSTGIVREEGSSSTHGPNCSCEVCTESQSKEREVAATKPTKETPPLKGPTTASVQNAMSHLQSELEKLLSTNVVVDKKNTDLIEENKRLKEENHKLKQELANLKQTLAKLAQVNLTDDEGSVVKTSPPHGTT